MLLSVEGAVIGLAERDKTLWFQVDTLCEWLPNLYRVHRTMRIHLIQLHITPFI